MSIAIIGSGAIGRALATRFAKRTIAISVAVRRESSSFVDLVRELGFARIDLGKLSEGGRLR
jgi:predicted dinucleotide-binding enzyme